MLDTRNEIPVPAAEYVPENADELHRLADMSADLDGRPLEAGEAAATAASTASEAQAWAALPAMFGGILAMALPELTAVYIPENCQAWGTAMVPVAQKYGWNASAMMGPEMGLALATVPFAVGTFAAVRAHKARLAATAQQQAGTVAETGGAPAGVVEVSAR